MDPDTDSESECEYYRLARERVLGNLTGSVSKSCVPGPQASSRYHPAHTGAIYKITSPSGKGYVGQTTQDIRKRMNGHKERPKCFAIANAIKKYGWDAMTVEVLLSGVPLEDLDSREDDMIEEHDTMAPNGYNLKRVGSQPYRARNHENCSAAVRAFHTKNPGRAKEKQNKLESVMKQKKTWFNRLIVQVRGLAEIDMKAARLKIMKAKHDAKWAAKRASKRCADTGRDPMKEFEECWGGVSIDDVIAIALGHAPFGDARRSPRSAGSEQAAGCEHTAKVRIMWAYDDEDDTTEYS
jgi:group I intron endonuclease